MPVSALEIVGAADIRGGTDLFVTTQQADAPVAGAPAATASITVNAHGYYQLWGGYMGNVQPASRSIFLQLVRNADTRNLERAVVRDNNPRWVSKIYEGWLSAGDLVRSATGGGALGDVGTVWVLLRSLGR